MREGGGRGAPEIEVVVESGGAGGGLAPTMVTASHNRVRVRVSVGGSCPSQEEGRAAGR
jgi:hypothetical protein